MYTYLIANKLLLISIAKYITNRAMIIYCYIAKLGTVTFFTNNSAPNCPSICMYMSKNNTTCIEQLRYFGFWLNNCLYISCSNEMQSL